MSKHVKKYCSILKYLEHQDPALYDIIDQLCLARNFLPRRNTAGVTFLRPDKEMLNEISDAAYGNNPESAVNMIQSLILLDDLDSLSDFGAKKDDIPTFLMTKLPVDKVTDKAVTLTTGNTIVADNKFEARKDRDNMSVYIISGKPIDLSSGPKATMIHTKGGPKPKTGKGRGKKAKVVRGGREVELSREDTWHTVCKIHCDGRVSGNSHDAAMELIVTLYACSDAEHRKRIELVSSCDTLASLFIILRPYASKNVDLYVNDEAYAKAVALTAGTKDQLNYTTTNPVEKYKKIMERGAALCADHKSDDERVNLAISAAPATVFTKIKTLAEKQADIMNSLCGCTEFTPLIAAAEAEARICFALWRNRGHGYTDSAKTDLANLVCKRKCSLNAPYFLDYTDPSWIKTCRGSSPIPFVYSVLMTAVRSDAFYLPCLKYTGNLKSVITEAENPAALATESLLQVSAEYYNENTIAAQDLANLVNEAF